MTIACNELLLALFLGRTLLVAVNSVLYPKIAVLLCYCVVEGVNIFIYEAIVSRLKLCIGLGKNSNHAISTVLSGAELVIVTSGATVFPLPSVYYTRIIYEFKSDLNTDL